MALASVEELYQLILTQTGNGLRLPESERLPLTAAVGRVLAEDVISAVNVPADNVSAMDGYALTQAASAGEVLTMAGESSAGRPFSGSLNHGEAIRIMTGAVVPSSCVAVVMQENTAADAGSLNILQDTPAGSNIRRKGEEIAIGQCVLPRGRIINEADVMLLSALGLAEVAVYRKIRVAILSSGDEIIEAGQPLTTGQIYDSNRPMLMARLHRLPAETVYTARMDDNLAAVKTALAQAAECADVVLTSGGVSVGDYDYLRQAVEAIGEIHHYKVAMKPGKPFVFGKLGRAWYFGLPGNPVSGYVGFDMFVQTALWQLCGASPLPEPLRFQAVLRTAVKKSPGRTDIQRAIIRQQADGTWTAEPAGAQDSHRILGVSRANAYMILPESAGSLAAGEHVWVQPFSAALQS